MAAVIFTARVKWCFYHPCKKNSQHNVRGNSMGYRQKIGWEGQCV